MRERARNLAHQIEILTDALRTYVQRCPEETWRRTCAEEDWTVGVVARHLAVGHFQIIHMAKSILRGEPLPAVTMEQIIEQGNTHAREHADCTRQEVLDLIDEHSAAALAFVAELRDEDLDCKGHLDLLGGEVSVEQLLTLVLIHSGGDHLTSMKAAAG